MADTLAKYKRRYTYRDWLKWRFKPTRFYKKVRDVEGDGFVIAMHHSLAQEEPEKDGNTLRRYLGGLHTGEHAGGT